MLANSRFIPENKRGWKYDLPAPAIVGAVGAASPSNNYTGGNTNSRTASDVQSQRPKTAGAQPASSSSSHAVLLPQSGVPRAALSAPVSPEQRPVTLHPEAPEMVFSDSSSSESEQEPDSPNEDDVSPPIDGSTGQLRANDAHQGTSLHPDDLVYPTAYPWKPSKINPKAKYIHPAHRNPTAKQAFYDTHFGSSSNYRGLLPASGSLLSLNPIKADSLRRSSDRVEPPNGVNAEADKDASSTGIVSTMKKPFASASKFLTKTRRKSMGTTSQPPEHLETSQAGLQDDPQRPHPTPLYAGGGGDHLAAQRSGFSYGLSMEDAAQVEAVVSRHASQEELNTAVQQDLLQSPSHDAGSSRWKEAMQSVWGFLPSFDFFASSASPADGANQTKAITSANILEPELIPSVKKDAGNPDYFKNLSGNVVIMGGYRGSVLRDAETNMMMWIPIKVGVGLRRPTLELGLSTEAEENSKELVYSSEMCTHIGKIVDMGKRLEERVAGRRRAKAYAWGYDWRLSLARSSRSLIAFLEQLYEASADQTGGHKRGAKVVAHSMGGLVALHALATCSNPRIFEGLVFASTPFCGTPNILGPFRFGDAALFNDTICSPRATFSFRSSFYLLPTDGRCFEIPTGDSNAEEEEDSAVTNSEERYRDVDFLDPDVWNELGFSPCLEIGRRQQVMALARKTSSTEFNAKAAQGKEPSQAAARARSTSAADSDLDTASPQGDGYASANGLTMGLMEGLTDGQNNPDVGQAELSPAAEEQAQLQPENRQGAERNHSSSTNPKATSGAEFDKLDYSTQAWLYLDRTLAEVREFWNDIEQGFDPAKLKDGSYPPIMLMASGRTPSVRGALVGVDEAYPSTADAETGSKGWKDDVRAGDYSRMTYGAGDGVITRHSATTLPGRWSTLLTKRSEAESLPEQLCGKGAPFPSKPGKPPGKARLKLDRYRMRFDGEGIVESPHRHVTLLSDVDGIGKCLEAVRRANLVRGRLPLDPE